MPTISVYSKLTHTAKLHLFFIPTKFFTLKMPISTKFTNSIVDYMICKESVQKPQDV